LSLCFSLLVTLLVTACDQAPENLFSGGGGETLKDWNKGYLVVNYWAEWCAPCREEIPELNELYHDHAEQGLLVVGVNYDAITGEPLAALIEKMGIGFPVLESDPRAIWSVELPQVLPTTLIIGPDGKLKSELVGPQSAATILAAIEE